MNLRLPDGSHTRVLAEAVVTAVVLGLTDGERESVRLTLRP